MYTCRGMVLEIPCVITRGGWIATRGFGCGLRCELHKDDGRHEAPITHI